MDFSQIVSSVIGSALGEFIEDVDAKKVDLQIKNGEATLSDLYFKTSALEKLLGVPIQVCQSLVKDVHIKLSWTNLLSQPIVATLSGVYLLCRSTQFASYEEFLEKQEELKQRALRVAFLTDRLSRSSSSSSSGFIESMKAKIIANIQFRIENFHLRWEQTLPGSSKIAAFGITLQRLEISTADENWKLAWVESKSSVVRKVVQANWFTSYLDILDDNDSSLLLNRASPLSHVDFTAALQAALPRDNKPVPKHSYLLNPASFALKCKIYVDDGFKMDIPQIAAEFDMDPIHISVSKPQYDGLFLLLQNELISVEKLKNASMRAKCGQGNDARVLWRFALSAVVADLREKARRFSWPSIQSRVKNRKQYIEIYKRILMDESLEAKLQPQLTAIEREFDVADILVFRTAAMKLADDMKSEDKEASKKGGLLQRFLGSFIDSTKVQKDEKTSEPLLDVSQALKGVYSAIGYNRDAIQEKYPADYNLARLLFNLPNVVVSLKHSADDSSVFAQVDFEASTATFTLRSGLSWLLEYNLRDLLIFDCTSVANQRTSILRKKTEAPFREKPVLSGSIEFNPLLAGSSSSSVAPLARVRVSLLPTDLRASFPFYLKLRDFLLREANDADLALHRILNAAQLAATASGNKMKQKIKTWTSSFLKADAARSFVDLELNLHGPTLHISNDTAPDTGLVVNFGRATLKTDFAQFVSESNYGIHFSIDDMGVVLMPKHSCILEPTSITGELHLSPTYAEAGVPRLRAVVKSPSMCVFISRDRVAIISEILRPVVSQLLSSYSFDERRVSPLDASSVRNSLQKFASSPVQAEGLICINDARVTVLEDIDGEESPLAVAGFQDLSLTATLDSDKLVADFCLQRLFIQDSYLERHLSLARTVYLLNCGSQDESANAFVRMKFRASRSMLDAQQTNDVPDLSGEIQVGVVDLSISRPTLSAFFLFVTSAMESLQALRPASHNQKPSKQEAFRRDRPIAPRQEGQFLAIRFTFSRLRLGLKSGSEEFLQSNLEQIEASLDLSRSSQLLLAGTLGETSAVLLRADSVIDIVRSRKNTSSGSFLFEYWIDRTVASYPGHDMFLSFTAKEMRFVVPIPLLFGIQEYFSHFSGIYDKLRLLRKGIASEGSRFLYRFEAYDSEFIVPKDSKIPEEDALLMKIGTFECFNKFEDDRDVLSLGATKMFCTVRSLVDGKPTRQPSIVKNFAISVRLHPRVAPNEQNRVAIGVPKVDLRLQSGMILFVWDVVMGNLSQEIYLSSEDENNLIAALLSADAAARPARPASSDSGSWRGVVDIKIDEATVTLIGVENQANLPFLHVGVTNAISSIGVHDDTTTVLLALGNIVALDLRKETPELKCLLFKSGQEANAGGLLTVCLNLPKAPLVPSVDFKAGNATLFLSPSHVECLFLFIVPFLRKWNRNPEPPVASAPDQVGFVVSSRVENLEIVLFSGSSTSLNAIRAPVHRFSLNGRISNQGHMEASALRISLEKCEAAEMGNVTNIVRLVEPCAIHVHAEQSGEKWVASLNLDRFFAIVSLSDVSTSILMVKELAESTAGLRSLLTAELSQADHEKPKLPNPAPNAPYQLQLEFSNIVLGLLDDSEKGVESPMLRGCASRLRTDVLLGSLTKSSTSLQEFTLSAFNSDLSGYDVIIEPWTAEVHISGYPLDIVGVSKTHLSANVSKSLIDNVIKAHSVFFGADTSAPKIPFGSSSSSDLTDISRRLTSPFMVKNEYDVPIAVCLTGLPESHIEIAPQQLAPLSPTSNGRLFTLQQSINHYMELQILGPETSSSLIEKIPISSVGLLSYPSGGGRPDVIIIDICHKGGSNLISVRPPFSVSNESDFEIHLEFETGAARAGVRLSPQSTVRLSAAFANWKSLQLVPLGPLAWKPCKIQSTTATSIVGACASEYEVWSFRLSRHSKVASTRKDVVLKVSPCYVFENAFPESIHIDLSADQGKRWHPLYQIPPGESVPGFISPLVPIPSCVVRLRIGNYSSTQMLFLPQYSPESTKQSIPIVSKAGHVTSLNVEVSPLADSATMKLLFFPSLWLTNVSGLNIKILLKTPDSKQQAIALFSNARMDPDRDPSSWYATLQPQTQRTYFADAKIAVQVAEGGFSRDFALPSGEDMTPIREDISGFAAGGRIPLTVVLYAAPARGRFWRSTEVSVSPKLMIHNCVGVPVQYSQDGTNTAATLRAGASLPLHLRPQMKSKLRIKPHGGEFSWSGSVSVLSPVSVNLPVPCASGTPTALRLSVQNNSGVHHVFIRERDPRLTPIVISNSTQFRILVRQRGIKFPVEVPAASSIEFDWNEPEAEKRELVIYSTAQGAASPVTFDPWTQQTPVEFRLFDNYTCTLAIASKSHSKVVVIAPPTSAADVIAFFPWLWSTSAPISIRMKNFSASVCLIDVNPLVELGHLTFTDASLSIRKNGPSTTVSAKVHQIQLDNHLPQSPFPVMISTRQPNLPALELSCQLDSSHPEVSHIPSASVIVRPLEVSLDEEVIFRSIGVIERLISYIALRNGPTDASVTRPIPALPQLPEPNTESTGLLSINELSVSDINFVLSLSKATSAAVQVSGVQRFLKFLLSIASIKEAEMNIPALRLDRFQSTSSELNSLLVDHVSDALRGQISKLILHTLSSSIRGIFVAPESNKRTPMRPPRYFSPTGLITAYDSTLSKLQESLKAHDIQEQVLSIFHLRNRAAVVITPSLLLITTLDARCTITTNLPRRSIQHISSNDEGDILILAHGIEPLAVTLKDKAAVTAFVGLFPAAQPSVSTQSNSSSTQSTHYIASIRVHCQKYVDKITLIYGDGTESGKGGTGGQPRLFRLKPKERIVRIICEVGPTMKEDVMKQITFETNFGNRHGPYGEQTTASRRVVYNPPPGMQNPGLVDLETELATFTILLGQQCLGPKLIPFWLPFPE